MTKIFLIAIVIFTLAISDNSYAQDTETSQKLGAQIYSPDYCQFTANFPEEPYKTKQCEGDTEDTCYDLVSYTKVIDLSSTVRVEIICNPATPAMYEDFTQKVLEATVRAMTKGTVLEVFDVKSRQEDKFRQASLVGQARAGLYDSIYIAQIWVADNSIMSVEAEMSGVQSDKADDLFASILQSIGFSEDINGDQPTKEEKKD